MPLTSSLTAWMDADPYDELVSVQTSWDAIPASDVALVADLGRLRSTTAVLLPGRISTGWRSVAAGGNADSTAPASHPCRADQQGPDQVGGRIPRVDRHEDRVGHQVLARGIQVVEVAWLEGQLEEVLGEQQLVGRLIHAGGGRLAAEAAAWRSATDGAPAAG